VNALETKGVKCVSVVHAGIAEKRKAEETKEIGVNTENTEIRSTEDTERGRWSRTVWWACCREFTTHAITNFMSCQV